MNRRELLKSGGIFSLGSFLLGAQETVAKTLLKNNNTRKAKNIIFLVSDGMSQGTLSMADLYLQKFHNRPSHWIHLYQTNKVKRGLMDMASASSSVTDSAAASSSWGSGERVRNGSINVSTKGKNLKPIWKKMKDAGKKAGCVTTVPVTHATPAGFTANSERRNSQEEIAEQLIAHRYDVMMGGGRKYFDAKQRSDKKEILQSWMENGGLVVSNITEAYVADKHKPIFGLFADDSMPYTIDYKHSKEMVRVPTLAEMTQIAIDRMKDHKEGFVLQVEGGKVDWAAHANDIAGLIFDQIAFDDAIKVAIDFAEKDKNTLVIITTDHGNANPGLMYGSKADENFERLSRMKHSNDYILNSISSQFSIEDVISLFKEKQDIILTPEEAEKMLSYYKGLTKEGGVYNYKNLPYSYLADILQKQTSIGWISNDHTSDYVEIAMFGPGSEVLNGFILNTDLHFFMLDTCGVSH